MTRDVEGPLRRHSQGVGSRLGATAATGLIDATLHPPGAAPGSAASPHRNGANPDPRKPNPGTWKVLKDAAPGAVVTIASSDSRYRKREDGLWALQHPTDDGCPGCATVGRR